MAAENDPVTARTWAALFAFIVACGLALFCDVRAAWRNRLPPVDSAPPARYNDGR